MLRITTKTHPVVASTRGIARRTRGRRDGPGGLPVTRLMSPSDFGQLLKPFVFLDLLDYVGPPFMAGLHPHSGIATLTYICEGEISYIDPANFSGVLPAGGVEWMQAGRGMWHGGGISHEGRTRGFQLWIALPPTLELGPTRSLYLSPSEMQSDGPVRVLLGRYGAASSAIEQPAPINYFGVCLKAGQRWRYEPPEGHTILWVAIAAGELSVPDALHQGELVAFDRSDAAVEFEALTDAEFVLGSAVPHNHDLVLGYYSVHTSPQALRDGEAQIAAIRKRLVQEGRI
jgi:redox-sensitive bicupin YhaK (pirin superfamily)